MSEALFSLVDVEKRYGNQVALQVSRLDFHAGRLYTLTGPNGSGKSTLLQIMALLLRPENGRLVYRGDTVTSSQKQRRLIRQEVTLVHQAAYLFNADVFENLAYGLKLHNVPARERERRIDEALQQVGLKGFAQRRAWELSGGEKQRLALARALVLRPRVLLLDEPMASINPQDIPLIEDLIKGVKEASETIVVMATHDSDQPQRLGADNIQFENGRVKNLHSL